MYVKHNLRFKIPNLIKKNNYISNYIYIYLFYRFKLLLIITLAMLSLARSRPVARKGDAVSLHYNNELIDSESKITLDVVIEESGYPAKIAIDALKPLSTNAETFRAIANTTFDSLLIGAALTTDEEECGVVARTFNNFKYVLFVASAYLYTNKKIAPSIARLVANSPKMVGTTPLTKDCSYS